MKHRCDMNSMDPLRGFGRFKPKPHDNQAQGPYRCKSTSARYLASCYWWLCRKHYREATGGAERADLDKDA